MATTEERVLQLAAENLEMDGGQIGLDGNVADSDLSSVAVVAFVRLVGQELNVELPPADVSEMKSLRDLVNYIEAKSA